MGLTIRFPGGLWGRVRVGVSWRDLPGCLVPTGHFGSVMNRLLLHDEREGGCFFAVRVVECNPSEMHEGLAECIASYVDVFEVGQECFGFRLLFDTIADDPVSRRGYPSEMGIHRNLFCHFVADQALTDLVEPSGFVIELDALESVEQRLEVFVISSKYLDDVSAYSLFMGVQYASRIVVGLRMSRCVSAGVAGRTTIAIEQPLADYATSMSLDESIFDCNLLLNSVLRCST